MLYRGPPAEALIAADLDSFTAVFHRMSGITHLLVSPAPELLGVLGEEPMTLDTLLDRLACDYDLGDANRDALTARLDELIAAGLVERV